MICHTTIYTIHHFTSLLHIAPLFQAFLVGYVGRQSQLFISALSTLPAELASTASPRRATRVVLGAVLGVVATAM